MITFNEWCKTIGIDITNQNKHVVAQLIMFEALYDLIVDTRRNTNTLPKGWN